MPQFCDPPNTSKTSTLTNSKTPIFKLHINNWKIKWFLYAGIKMPIFIFIFIFFERERKPINLNDNISLKKNLNDNKTKI